MTMKLKWLDFERKLPTRATEGSAGYDIFAPVDLTFVPGVVTFVRTGFSVELEKGTAMLVLSRSGMGVKKRVNLAQKVGLIDEDYRGEVIVPLINEGMEEVFVAENTAIAQFIIIPYVTGRIEVVSNLEDTVRGSGGFGSTGL